jgi:2-hydroxycyclohexanecarboxyl-CoA dehydrogenase
MSEILDLAGRIAFVTGAGQGVGRQIALHLAAHNAGGVAVNDYVLERAESVVGEIEAAGGRAIPVQADVSDYESVKEAFARTATDLGPVGVLVNNAGNAGANPSAELGRPFWETGPEVWESFIGVNFDGVINCTSQVIPGMIEANGGRIITIISDAGRWGDVGLAIYAGAKAGAAGFMRSVARTLGRYNITANCVAIAATVTPATETGLTGDPEQVKRVLRNYIIRRPGQPTDVANMVLFLASDSNGWITGQTYPVNGGFSLAL